MFWTPQQYAEYAWERLPAYDIMPSHCEALKQRRGTCLDRSRVIGRKALALHHPSFRRILFGSNNVPANYGNYLLGEDGTAYDFLTTGHTPGMFYVQYGVVDLMPVRIHVGNSTQGMVPVMEASTIDMVAIPETMVGAFRGCRRSSEFLERARLIESQRQPESGDDA